MHVCSAFLAMVGSSLDNPFFNERREFSPWSRQLPGLGFSCLLMYRTQLHHSQACEMRENYQYRILEYTELERIHQNHQIQLLSLCKTQQVSHHMSESVVQMKYSKNKAFLITNSWDLQRGEYVRMTCCRENILWINILLHILVTLLVYYFY